MKEKYRIVRCSLNSVRLSKVFVLKYILSFEKFKYRYILDINRMKVTQNGVTHELSIKMDAKPNLTDQNDVKHQRIFSFNVHS